MFIKVLREVGYEEALLGLSLSYYDHEIPAFHWVDGLHTDLMDSRISIDHIKDDNKFFWTTDKYDRAHHRVTKQAHMQEGHNKFLESIQVWIYIQASRDFWQEFDTYRVGVTKQSSSTMHTLDKRIVTKADFEDGTSPNSIYAFNLALKAYKDADSLYYKDVSRLKKNLPEGWLQERVICTNYKVLQHIHYQRAKHRLASWKHYIAELPLQLAHPEFLINKDNNHEF